MSGIHAEGCSGILNKSTRITETSATLLNHMYTKMSNHLENREILAFDISDHLPTICFLSLISVTKEAKT